MIPIQLHDHLVETSVAFLDSLELNQLTWIQILDQDLALVVSDPGAVFGSAV